MKFHNFKIMGIVNLTPDSFSDGGDYSEISLLEEHIVEMIANSVDIVDIGGESTRPGSEPVSLDEELIRVIPPIKFFKRRFPNLPLSIDTTKFEVARTALESGVEYINDISGLQFEPRFAELAAEYDSGLIIMHMQGNPKDMQQKPYYSDIVEEVYSFLFEKVELARSYGAKKIWVDPGIGFGKTVEHNLELLKNLDKFNNLGAPLLLGISRKSFLGKLCEIDEPKERDLATVICHSLLLPKGVDILRVHNVRNLNLLRKLMNYLG